jgi:hypothetical protein
MKPWNVLVNIPNNDIGVGTKTLRSTQRLVRPDQSGSDTDEDMPVLFDTVRPKKTGISSQFCSAVCPLTQEAGRSELRLQQLRAKLSRKFESPKIVAAETDALPNLPGKFLVLELCGGSARLTKCFFNSGCDAFAIDWVRNSSTPEGPSVLMDLCEPRNQKYLMELAKTNRVKYVHLGPPCGTASRARERPIPEHLRKLGVPEPKPLRSSQFPLGVPGLKDTDLVKVTCANKLYEFCAAFITLIHSLGILWSLENPFRSWFWSISFVEALISLPGVWDTIFANCAH